MTDRLHKVEPCSCGSKQLELCELFGKYSLVQCKECSAYGGLAETKLDAVKQWNEARLRNEEASKEEQEKYVH